MTGPLIRALTQAAVLLPLLAALPARAQTTPPDPQQELYRDALQSLAEGRKNDASDQFARVIEKEPLHAGAWLDLALIQCGLGNAEEAERLFAEVETRFNPSRGMLEVIANARSLGCNHWQAVSNSSVAIGRGIDQNVNQGANNPDLPLLADFLPKHDQYSVLSTEYTRDLTPNGSLGFAQFQARRNDRLSQYDSASLFVGAEAPYRLGRWTMRASGMVGLVSLGGVFYQRHAQLQARIGPPLPLPNSTQFTLMGGLSHVQYLTMTNFDSTTAELRGQLTYRRSDWFASASLGYLDDIASSQRPGGSRRGWFNNLQVRKALSEKLTAEAAWTRQTWQSESAYLPGLLDQVRDQSTSVLRGTLIYGLRKNLSLQLDARVVRNHENIAIFQYNNRQLQLSLQWQGP